MEREQYKQGKIGIFLLKKSGEFMKKVKLLVMLLFVVLFSNDLSADRLYWCDGDWGDASYIKSCNPDGSDITTVIELDTGFYGAMDIDIDESDLKIYWLSPMGLIDRSSLDGTGYERITSIVNAWTEHIFVNEVNRKIYFTNANITNAICRIDFDGSNYTEVIDESARCFDIDSVHNKIYYVTLYEYMPPYANQAGRIWQSNLDGSDSTIIFQYNDNEWPLHIAVNLSEQKIYWTTNRSKFLKADFDGSNSEVLFDLGDIYCSGLAIDEVNEKMYWINHTLNKIQRANLDGTGIEDIVTGLSDNPYGIDILITKEKYGGGSGIPGDPYLIFTPDEMDKVGQYAGDWNKYFKLMADVDMSLCSSPDRAMIGEYLFNTPRAIVLDAMSGRLYWADWGYETICQAELDGTHRQSIISAPTPLGLSIDNISGKIYWTDNALDNIQRSDLDGGGIEELVTGLTTPVGIVLDVSSSKMYWVDIGTGELERANLDGSNVETILSSLQGPEDLALDQSNSKVYWTENTGGRIGKANLDGSQVEYIVTSIDSPYGIVADVTNEHIYWSDNTGIHRASLEGSGQVLLISASDVSIPDFDIDFDAGMIYWVVNSSVNLRDKMYRANINGSNVEVLMRNFFTGVFDGGGHTVDNFALSYSAKERVGLFGVLETSGASVKKLGVVNPMIEAPSVKRVGGLIGQILEGTIEECFVKGGCIIGASLVGGLTGVGSDCSLVNCYTQTTVVGDHDVGGMIGLDFSSSLSCCYASTVVDGNSLCGGLVGGGSSSAFPDCFWDVEISGQSTSDGGVDKTTLQMQTKSTYTDAGWDFVDTWGICEGTNYPKLVWSISVGDFVCPDGVDSNDLAVLCEQWLFEEIPDDLAPDGGDGVVNFLDWAVFAEGWQIAEDYDSLAAFAEQWLKTGSNYLNADIAPVPVGDKIVNMLDFTVLADNWLEGF